MAKREILPGIPNHHYKSCGVPPKIDLSQPHGHFENELGEQGVMSFDMETGICRVWMGDCGWEKEIRVEEFRGHIIVRYLEDYPQNEYWKGIHGDMSELSRERDEEFERAARSIYEREFGRLADHEYALIRNKPIICRDSERRPIVEFYQTSMKARERFLRAEERRRAKEDREAAKAERQRLAEEKQAERQRLWDEERALNTETRQLKKEQREEVKALREQIDKTRRLLRGEPDPAEIPGTITFSMENE